MVCGIQNQGSKKDFFFLISKCFMISIFFCLVGCSKFLALCKKTAG